MRCILRTILAVAGVGSAVVSVALLWQAVTVGFGNSYDRAGDAAWILDYLQRPGTYSTLKNHDAHPTRGWIPKARLDEDNPPCHTNSRGQRGTEEYSNQPDKYVVLAFGDSFTFGAEAADQDTWPALLGSLDKRLQVVNLGVNGYGLDQMFIALRETVGEYRPSLVLFAPIADDLQRSMLSFRSYRKPRFVLDENRQLLLTNVPIGGERDTASYIRERFGLFFVKDRLRKLDEQFMLTLADGRYHRELQALNDKIIREANRCTREAGADFLLVHLATMADLPENVAILDALGKSGEINCLSTANALSRLPQPWSNAHYQRREATVVAETIFAGIQQLPSWKAFTQR